MGRSKSLGSINSYWVLHITSSILCHFPHPFSAILNLGFILSLLSDYLQNKIGNSPYFLYNNFLTCLSAIDLGNYLVVTSV